MEDTVTSDMSGGDKCSNGHGDTRCEENHVTAASSFQHLQFACACLQRARYVERLSNVPSGSTNQPHSSLMCSSGDIICGAGRLVLVASFGSSGVLRAS